VADAASLAAAVVAVVCWWCLWQAAAATVVAAAVVYYLGQINRYKVKSGGVLVVGATKLGSFFSEKGFPRTNDVGGTV
jgi:hypothetical protein